MENEDKGMENIKVRIRGIRPLLMHSAQSMTASTTKTKRADTHYDPIVEAKKALYTDKKGKIGLPALNILATIKGGGGELPSSWTWKKDF